MMNKTLEIDDCIGFIKIECIKYPFKKISDSVYDKLKIEMEHRKGIPVYVRINENKEPDFLPTPNRKYDAMILDEQNGIFREYKIGE